MTTTSRADLEAQGRDIVEALGGKWSPGRGGLCRCPAHADNGPSLSVRPGDVALLLHCFAGCDNLDVIDALWRAGSGVRSVDGSGATPDRATAPNLQPIVERLWREGRGVNRSLAADYLLSRCLTSHSAQLRFHPRVQLGPSSDATFHPALLAAVRDDTGLLAVHRTFLDPIGIKAKMVNPKRLLGNPGTGAVRIGQPGRVLGLAEGVETALAASRIHGFPVWAILGNERFGMVTIPSHVERLVLLADNDTGGKRATMLALTGQQRPGLSIEIIAPPDGINDWCDVLETTGGEGAGEG